MSDVFAQRGVVDALRLEHETALASADDQEVALPLLELSINNGTFEGHHPFTNQEWLEINRENQRQRREAVAEKKARLEDAERALEATLGEGKPLFRQRNAEPIALLPVRLETRFADASTIQVRVYPDDLHIDSFDPRLTRAELEAGRRYWRKPSEAAWQRLLGRLSPARAAWVTRATRRGAPAPRLRRPGQRRSPAISTLPTRWRFLGLVGGSIVVDKRGEPIPSPLPLGVLEVDEADRKHAAWVVHFKAAERAGMATTLTLPDGVAHLDELFVIGVQRSTPAAASKALRDTLMGHAFGAGLGFLAPGTPTNNTPQSRSGWSSRPLPRPPGPRRPKLERGTDAARLAGALGLPDAAFLAECPGAGGKAEQALAGLTMLTWGALGHGMMDASIENDLVSGQGGLADAEKWRPVRDHLIDYVRSRGPLPTIRVGNQPYGVLPATSLDEWEAKLIMGPTTVFVPWLLRLRHHWRAALAPGWIPRVTDGEPADRTAVAVLSRLPVPVDLAVRRMLLPNGTRDKLRSRASGPALSIGGVGPGSNLRWSMATELTSNLSFTGNETPPDYALGMQRLDPEPGGLTEVLTASRELWTDALAVVRGKLELREYRRRRRRRPDTLASISGNREFPGLVAAMLHPDNWFAWNVDDGADDPLREALSLPGAVDDLASLLLGPAPSGDDELIAQARTTARKCARRAPEVIEAIAALEATPPDRLLPLAFEVLDVYSHRLDAWITSLATRRLLAMRDTGESTASRIGGYGWVENLRPKENLPQIDGYIHAPSLHHAATAAVLRSGFRSHDGDETLAVNLTSRRARIARWLLGGVRRGQELGSLLGYRFERALHEAGQDELIDDFRRAYPAQVAPEPEAGADPEEWRRSSVAIAARNIVDGIALARDHVRAASVFPAAAPQIADAVDALDAVSDLLLAESVHQLVGGNAMRAGLSADNLGRGEQVPDRFDVLRTPHRGRAVTHRIAAILPRAASAGEGWSPDALSALDPRVDAWVADALGPAQSRRVTGTLTREGGVGEPFAFGADQLGFGALTTALEVSGAEVQIAAQAGHVSASDHTIVYRAEGASPSRLTWFDRGGRRTGSVGEPGRYYQLVLSPRGRHATVVRGDAQGKGDIWDADLATGIFSRLTTHPADDSDPAWAPDERALVFSSSRTGRSALFVKDVTSGKEDPLVPFDGPALVDQWTPDGRFIIFRSFGKAVYSVSVQGDRTPRMLADTPFIEDEVHVSPGGRWVAYNANESGRWEVYVAAFPTFTSKRQISSGGGVEPQWRADGRELFYLAPDSSMMSVRVEARPEFTASPPTRLFATNIAPDPNVPRYAVTADGRRFLGLERTGEDQSFTFLLNWLNAKPANGSGPVR